MAQLAPPSQPSAQDNVQENIPQNVQRVEALETNTPETNTLTPQRPNSDALETFVFNVGGMMCAGCVTTVEKKLAQHQDVVLATVNLVTEVAAVTCHSQANPQAIAQTLTDAGYPSQLRVAQGQSAIAAETDWLTRQERAQQDQARQVLIALTLLICSTLGHLQHFHWAQGWSIPILSTLWFHGSLATLTLIFPARKILIEGAKGAWRGNPNMNTLVSLGALSAYLTSLVALIFPGLSWECFFDEPVMLLSFILLGRTVEQRARFQAASSLRSLIALQPTLARLVPKPQTPDINATDIDSPNINSPNIDPPESDSTDIGVQIPANQVQVGEWLRVLPSEKIPVDGVVVVGQTTVDESMLTGESMPVIKQAGQEVVAGSLNQSGAITIQVNRTGTNTTLAQMIQLVETAQTRKAPIQGLADAIAGYFTYGVLTCAALTFCFWYFIGVPTWPEIAQSAMMSGHYAAMHLSPSAIHLPITAPVIEPITAPVTEPMTMTASHALRLLVSLKLAIAVVVIACPCALGLATPTAILVGSGLGAEQGLLIRGGDILETTHGLNTLVFDKTGTLTTGTPKVTDCLPLVPNLTNDQLLQIAATVESGTRHPLGTAIQHTAQQKGLTVLSANTFQTEAGLGISANVTFTTDSQTSSTHPIFVGNLAWMEKNNCTVSHTAHELALSLGQAGKTAVLIAQAHQLIGLIGVADTLRADALDTIQRLQAIGLEVRMLSGDTPAAATAIAQQLGLAPEQVQANVTPQGKVDAIAQLKTKGDRVGFIGDGINDAPALAAADIGIALNSGTEVAMETADIVLMGDTLSEVLAAIQLSRITFNKIRQNLAWAFGYNLICIPLAAGAFLPAFGLSLNPGIAGGLMAFSSLTVVLNSLLLKVQHTR